MWSSRGVDDNAAGPALNGAAMNDVQHYLATEIAENCAEGQITRSEAMRRLRTMGLSAAVALSLLAACGGDDGNAAETRSTTSDSAAPAGSDAAEAAPETTEAAPETTEADPSATEPSTDDPPDPTTSGPGMGLETEALTFMGPNGELRGAFATADNPRGAVLVIHENRGLNDHIRTVVGRFAAAGFAAIGLDLLSEEGGSAAFDEADVPGQLSMISMNAPDRFVQDMQACLDELERRAPGAPIGAIGFCFGGGMTWQLIASGDSRLAAAAPFYGTPPTDADFTGSSAAVLAMYGENDARVNATREAATAALVEAGLTHEIVTAPGASHAFFNDTGRNYDEAAAADAWARVLEWFDEHLN